MYLCASENTQDIKMEGEWGGGAGKTLKAEMGRKEDRRKLMVVQVLGEG